MHRTRILHRPCVGHRQRGLVDGTNRRRCRGLFWPWLERADAISWARPGACPSPFPVYGERGRRRPGRNRDGVVEDGRPFDSSRSLAKDAMYSIGVPLAQTGQAGDAGMLRQRPGSGRSSLGRVGGAQPPARPAPGAKRSLGGLGLLAPFPQPKANPKASLFRYTQNRLQPPTWSIVLPRNTLNTSVFYLSPTRSRLPPLRSWIRYIISR